MFYRSLAEYFAHFIFKCVGMNPDEEISLNSLKGILNMNREGSDIIDMFCGQDNIQLCV